MHEGASWSVLLKINQKHSLAVAHGIKQDIFLKQSALAAPKVLDKHLSNNYNLQLNLSNCFLAHTSRYASQVPLRHLQIPSFVTQKTIAQMCIMYCVALQAVAIVAKQSPVPAHPLHLLLAT